MADRNRTANQAGAGHHAANRKEDLPWDKLAEESRVHVA